MNGFKPNTEIKLKSLSFDPLSKVIQREDGIPAQEFLALSSATTSAKKLKHASGLKTKIAKYMNDLPLILCLPFIFGEPPHPGSHTMLR